MEIWAGIDGGGTGTALELIDAAGNMVAKLSFGPFNLNSIGEERFKALLAELFDAVRTAGDCRGVCIGAAGISNPAVKKWILEAAGKADLDKQLLLCGDQDIALYGATGGEPGSILIAGTGSVCTGRNVAGKMVRAGGWGHLIDDPGSGYALGRDALAAAVQSYDGRRGKTILLEMLLTRLSIPSPEGLIPYIYNAPDKSRIAGLSPLVEEAAHKGDEAAAEIIYKNAAELIQLVQAVSLKLEMKEMPLSLLGGLLIHDTLLQKAVREQIKVKVPEARVQEPVMGASRGAAGLAKETFLFN